MRRWIPENPKDKKLTILISGIAWTKRCRFTCWMLEDAWWQSRCQGIGYAFKVSKHVVHTPSRDYVLSYGAKWGCMFSSCLNPLCFVQVSTKTFCGINRWPQPGQSVDIHGCIYGILWNIMEYMICRLCVYIHPRLHNHPNVCTICQSHQCLGAKRPSSG